jgi:adenosylmethionine-8-amino-7-oxononanoate aminotransferase
MENDPGIEGKRILSYCCWMSIQNNNTDADMISGLARQHLIQPWPTAGAMGAETRAFIGAGDGLYVYDENGKALMDGPAGMWCVNAGHRNADLARVMHEQALQLGYASPW